jgi:predicted nucleotidyltransferase
MLSKLAKNILTTVVYYDVLDYPLTAFEIWKYLIRAQEKKSNEEENFDLAEIMAIFEGSELKNLIEEYQGFYFLQNRQELVAQRIERAKISEEKLKIIFSLAQWLRFIPFLRMIAVTGRLSMKNAEKGSDIDVLIAIRKGKIFTGRLLFTLAVHFLGKRRHDKKITDRICLNYFITDNSLEIKLKDMFSASEYFFALPIFGWETFKNFQKANSWIAEYKPNYFPAEILGTRVVKDSAFSRFLRKLGERALDFNWIEKNLKNWQLEKIKKNPKTKQAGSLIVVEDDALVFLPEPQGPKIFEKFSLKVAAILEKNRKSQGIS